MATIPRGNTTVTWTGFRPRFMSGSNTNKLRISQERSVIFLLGGSFALFSGILLPNSYRKLARSYHPDVSKNQEQNRRLVKLTRSCQMMRINDRYGGDGLKGSNMGMGKLSSGLKKEIEGLTAVTPVMAQVQGQGQRHLHIPTCVELGKHRLLVTRGGDGKVRKPKRISLKVPVGVDSGSRLRVRAEGNAGRREASPSFVVIEVLPDLELKRDDTNILYTCKISYVDAILGTTVKVPTVDGSANLKIPAGIQPGTTLVMAKKGVHLLNIGNIRREPISEFRWKSQDS
ncbi:hypothetical protein CRYUN_Cryun10bG0096500 [Craigia yunnanensis]